MDKLTEHHLKNLASGKSVRNKSGSISTIRTLQFGMPGGKTMVVPSVWDGKILEDRAALKRAQDAGVFEVFDSDAAATKFDKRIHNENKILGGRMKPISADKAAGILKAARSRSVMGRAAK
tara:strand:- start:317 stop:679 length:363 start_codon:yes stop_codon:yes gene_type:complete